MLERIYEHTQRHKKTGRILYQPDCLKKNLFFCYPSLNHAKRGSGFKAFKSLKAAMKYMEAI